MRAPCAGVPLPGGRPLPSGRMLMSQARISDSETGCPRPGVSPALGAAKPRARSRTGNRLCIDMPDLPLAVDCPAGDAVEVLVRERRDRRDARRLAAHGHELRARRLRIAGLVPGAALQYRRTAVPAPGHAEAGEGLGEHRLLQRRLRPAAAAVG